MASWGPGSTREKLWRLQGGLCCYCECAMTKPPVHQPRNFRPARSMATLEHLRRKEDGGRNIPDNYALACVACNSARGLMDWLTYKTYIQDRISVANAGATSRQLISV